MARRLFFVPEVRNGSAELVGDDAKHLTRVLRVEPGQTYQISDNQSLYLAEVEEAHKGRVKFRVLERQFAELPRCAITLCAALIKFDHFEWMIEKVTELGVSRIIPVEAARSEKGLERAALKRVERWRKIALEAAQQSRRAFLPTVDTPITFDEALQTKAAVRLFADEEGGESLSKTLPAQTNSIAILIGPEGGWTFEERDAAMEWKRVTLGSQVLRAETAAITAVAVVSHNLLI
jgi:16S rRNA (uracil1498-N3)-methyltransferase